MAIVKQHGCRYRVIPTGGSSYKYGNCEVCDLHAESVVHQVEEKRYESGKTTGWSYSRSLFGHELCLKQQQKSD